MISVDLVKFVGLFRRVDLSSCSLGNRDWNLLPTTDARISVTDLVIGHDWLQDPTQEVLSYLTNVKSIDIQSNGGPVDARRLVIYLQQQPHEQRWRHIDVLDSLLDDAFIQTIADSIRLRDNVESLNLVRNELSMHGLESIKDMLWSCKNMDKLTISIRNDSLSQFKTLVDCLSGDTTLRELIVHLFDGELIEDNNQGHDDNEDWMLTLLLSGIEKNSSLQVFEGVNQCPVNQLQLDSFLLRNRFITDVRSLDNAFLAASRPAVVDALCAPCQHDEGTNATWMILLCHSNSLFGDGGGTPY
jgi:hypothetical protein